MSNYSSALTIGSGSYIRPGSSSSGHHYEAIQVIVNTTGYYTFTSSSNMDTHGFLYNGAFYPSQPSVNLIARDDDSGGNNQFKFAAFLEAGVPYILVISTHGAGITGPFSIVASGPDDVEFIPTNIVETITTMETTNIMQTTMMTTGE